jgi:transcriptional regulator with XRE-family HTH domain
MSRTPGKNYLKRHRLRTALTLRELAALFGISENTLARYEQGLRHVPAEIVLASERIFGVSGPALFPALYNSVEEDLAARALELHDRLAGRLELGALKKRALMSGIENRFQ